MSIVVYNILASSGTIIPCKDTGTLLTAPDNEFFHQTLAFLLCIRGTRTWTTILSTVGIPCHKFSHHESSPRTHRMSDLRPPNPAISEPIQQASSSRKAFRTHSLILPQISHILHTTATHHVIHNRAPLARSSTLHTQPPAPIHIPVLSSKHNPHYSNLPIAIVRLRLHAPGPRHRPQNPSTEYHGCIFRTSSLVHRSRRLAQQHRARRRCYRRVCQGTKKRDWEGREGV